MMQYISVPHNVQVSTNPSARVLQNSSLTLTCEATGGNPTEVLSYRWNFEPRYKGTSELISNTNKHWVFDSVQYTNAGVYTCAATNMAGVGNGSEEILVNCK